MDTNRIEEDQIDIIIKHLLSDLCHDCIEEICNSTLKKVQKLKIDSPFERVHRYLTFLNQKIANMKIDDKNYADCGHNYRDCEVSYDEMDNDSENLLSVTNYEKMQSYFSTNQYYDNKKTKKKRKKKL